MVKRDWEDYIRALLSNGGVAQLGEHLPCKQGVRSSILLISTTFFLLKKKESKENFSVACGRDESLGGGNFQRPTP